MIRFILLIIGVSCGFVHSDYDQDGVYIPQYLASKYGNLGQQNSQYGSYGGGVKTTNTKSFIKTGGSSYTKTKIPGHQYSGGCSGPPPTPTNAALRCSKFTGCRIDCVPHYQLPNGVTQAYVNCENGKWIVDGTDWNHIPSCEPICLPACKNNGICVAPNQCNCPENFSGPQCQFEQKPCLNYPALPLNSRRLCRSQTCSITCLDGHQFPDGSTITNLVCKDSNWVPTKETWASIPNCQATCTPPCENGGNCLSFNVCQCPQAFRGPQCQYSVEACNARKLQFNGGYNCSGSGDIFECSVSCPEGIPFTFLPAPTYVCSYSTGVFVPSPVPQCEYATNIETIPLGSEFDIYNQFTGSNSYESHHSYHHKKPVEIDNFLNDSNVHKVPDGEYSHQANQYVIVEETLPKPGVCFTWAGTHYKTFDGKVFSFVSQCTHVMVRDDVDGTFSLMVQNSKECDSKPELCYRIVKVYYQDKEYILKKGENGLPILKTQNKVLPIPGQLPGIRTEISANFVTISLDTVGAIIKWDGKYLVQIEIKENLWNRTNGLCGTMDGNPNNDVKTRDGLVPKTLVTLATSWQVDTLDDMCNFLPTEEHACQDSEPKSRKATKFCKKLMSDERFSPCHKIMDVRILEDTCRWDYCSCQNKDPAECACETMNVYVKECIHKGVTSLVNWRDDNTCPMKCGKGKIYKACGPSKGQPVCGSTTEIFEESDDCVEGCYCPEGTVLHENQCITKNKCPCRLRGKSFPAGSSVPKECNTCTCVDGQWVCTQVSCGARCSAIGDPHYKTFDGKTFDFMGQCSYYLVKTDNFSIEAENVPCAGAISQAMNFPLSISSGMPSCTKMVTLKVDGHSIKLKQNHELTVDGQDVTQIPYEIGKVKIRSVSSIFLLVELPNGVEVWWDGLTRVYVDVPSNLIGKTKGLCGTFNNNQKDDFLTPEGDIEPSVIPFANKWKTAEKCFDISEQTPHDTCELNVQNKQIALTQCEKIKSELFRPCHFFVDPDSYYHDCLYDMCACETKVSKCLCPIIAAYAQECSLLGVKIDWRNTVKECGIQCPNGQKYQVCGNSCTRTCDDIASRPNCRPQCVEGCNCPEGKALDKNGECIPIGQCSCQHDGFEFPAGYKEIRPASKAPELCTCTNAIWNCRPAFPMEMHDFPKVTDVKEKCNAMDNLEFTTCENPEPTTCKNMHSKELYSAVICHAGCQCKSGYVLDSSTKRCVLPSQCPCHHGGKSYTESSTVQNDCNTCLCKNGIWECTDRQCSAECVTWGDSHYQTFDGKSFDFQGQCDYILSKGFISLADSFDVVIQSIPCGSLGVTCSKSITIKVGFGPQQDTVTLTRHKAIPKDKTYNHLVIKEKGLFVIVEVPDFGMLVRWDKGTRVYVKVDPRWKNRVKGLCGNFNYNEADDFQTPSGGLTEVSAKLFGDSWSLQPYCPEVAEITDTCTQRPERKIWALKQCGILKTNVFAPCHSEVPIDKYMERCVFDSCACDQGGDCECLCTALAAYAQECNNHGVPIKWRSQELCPMQCDERCSNYSPCVSTCPAETCDNLLNQNSANKMCVEDTCIEGCEAKPCPPDHVYLNSSLLECVPRNACKVFCMELDGVTYFEGDIIEGDDCFSCFCSRGKKLCKGQQPCLTTSTSPPLTEVTRLNEQTVKCHDGWTEWINQDTILDKSKLVQKLTEIEPLPDSLVMFKLKTGGKCSADKMINIECRTVEGHRTIKETGLNDIECSLEKGFICRESVYTKGCPDFEIRVLCQCEELPYVIPTIPPAENMNCDVTKPNKAHPKDCHLFYQCVPGLNGPELVKKSCGESMYYNPQTQVCDWPNSVLVFKPECDDVGHVDETPMVVTRKPPLEEGVRPIEPIGPQCPPGQKYDPCMLHCNKMCDYYLYTIKEIGFCKNNRDCEEGCASADKKVGYCPPGLLWANNHTCVAIHDCLCASHNGQPVKPGFVYRESDCEICQCIDNFYTCDKSSCLNTIPPFFNIPSTHSVTEINPLLFLTSTVTPPKDCIENDFINLVQGDAPLPDVAFSASTVLNPHFEPKYARFLKTPTADSGGSWSPAISDKDQYLQVNLGQLEPVYGIIVMGSPIYNEYVTSYRLLQSSDGISFIYVTDETGNPLKFSGSIDANTPVKQMLPIPIETKILRINPQTWHNAIALRVEVIGCGTIPTTVINEITTVSPVISKPLCEDPMGVQNEMLPDQQITVSSELGPKHSKKHLKIKDHFAWQPLTNSPTEFIEFDFYDNRNLTGLMTKGGPNGWVKAFNIKYSPDRSIWNPVLDKTGKEKLFIGNHDVDSPQVNNFDLPISARFLRVIPILWNDNIQMRIEPFGCFLPYPDENVLLPTILPESPCNYCPDVGPLSLELESCQCTENLWWDGEDCVNRTQCPCVVGIIPYPIGAIYEKEDCSQCICKLGGVSHCTSQICSPCPEGLRTVVTNTCKCTCKPCETGTVLCPTSGICINESSWCNGVRDCPDDEVNCEGTNLAPTLAPSVLSTTPVPREKCPEKVCPPGFKVVLKENSKSVNYHSFLSPMFTGYSRKTKTAYQGVKTGIKGGTKRTSLERPTELLKNKEETEEECAEYQCINKKPPPPFIKGNKTVCPPVTCPIGFLPLYNEEEIVSKTDSCPLYTCNPPPPPDSVCNVTGRTFNTFDKIEYKYDICNHVIVRDLENDDWDISLKKNCTFSCAKDLIIRHQEHLFILHPDLSVEYDGYRYTIEQTKKIGSQSQFFGISRLGETLLFVSNQYGFWIIWDKQGNVKVGVVRKLLGKVDGLCGYFDDIGKNDKRKPDGNPARTTVEFGDSWAQPDKPTTCEAKVCPIHVQNDALEICNKVKNQVFSPCSRAIDINNFISRCLDTTCTCLETAKDNATLEDQCKCDTLQSFVVDCLTTDPTADLTDWRTLNDCPATCDAPFVYHDCYQRRCEPNCETISDPNICPKLPNLCFPGCYCPAGLLRKDHTCIKPSECRDCECNVLPHLQYVTYDGNNFTVNGNCVYVMSRDEPKGKDFHHDFQVLITNAPCRGKEDKQCVGKVTILYKGHKIHILLDRNRSKLRVIVDSEFVKNYSELEKWALVKETPAKHIKFLLKQSQIEVSVYFPSLGVSVKAPSHKYAGKLEGLCGNCNNLQDDYVTPWGIPETDINEFSLSWLYDKLPGGQIKENCINKPEEKCENLPVDEDPCIQFVDVNRFGQCHPLLDPTMFIDWCHKDTCGGHPERACTSIEAYASECMHSGFCINWHSELCPAETCPPGQTYESCNQDCLKTCEDVRDKDVKVCSVKPVEGCFCPKGKVLLNDTCVDEERCIVCDEFGHHSGETWQKDACTTCSCDGSSLKCETKQCSTIDTVCDDGFSALKVASNEQECCDKFICVPEATASPTCEPPQEIQCSHGQIQKIITKSDGCQQFICQCKPPEDCDNLETTQPPLDDGYEVFINTTGCCPVVEKICNKQLCPEPKSCKQFYSQEEEIIEGKCCPKYSCEPPKEKCIFESEYIADEKGGERVVTNFEKQKLLKDVNETWQDGPCRQCQCIKTSADTNQPSCSKMECPSLETSDDFADYTLEPVFIPNQCCPIIKRSGCKYRGEIYKVGEKWPVGSDHCTLVECVNSPTGVQKHTQVTNCDKNCDVGFEYKPAALGSKECCGACKPVACVIDGIVRNVGEKWSSIDHCTHYKCMNINGSLNIQSVLINCPNISKELVNNYVYETILLPGECCKKQEAIACKLGERRFEVGETLASPDDKCKNISCVKNELGEIVKQESLESCKTDCRKGWEYKESNHSCCGECIQVACVTDNDLKRPGENWTSPDNCTTYTCESFGDLLAVSKHEVTCPDVESCPVENLYTDGCCQFCNLTSRPQNLSCLPEEIKGQESIGLVKQLRAPHGECLNKEEIAGFTECIGHCESKTFFNAQLGEHESVCSCCQATKYEPLVVELVCEDGYRFKKQIAVPSVCGCESCTGEKKQDESQFKQYKLDSRFA